MMMRMMMRMRKMLFLKNNQQIIAGCLGIRLLNASKDGEVRGAPVTSHSPTPTWLV